MALPSNLTFAEMYERFLVEPLFRPFGERLLERARPTASDSVIDIACGTGIVARLARKQLGAAAKVVGVDVSGPMLAVARGIHATIDWREGNATTLPVPADERVHIGAVGNGVLRDFGRLAVRRHGFSFRPYRRRQRVAWNSSAARRLSVTATSRSPA